MYTIKTYKNYNEKQWWMVVNLVFIVYATIFLLGILCLQYLQQDPKNSIPDISINSTHYAIQKLHLHEEISETIILGQVNMKNFAEEPSPVVQEKKDEKKKRRKKGKKRNLFSEEKVKTCESLAEERGKYSPVAETESDSHNDTASWMSYEDRRFVSNIIETSDELTQAYDNSEQAKVARNKVPMEIRNMIEEYRMREIPSDGSNPEYGILMKLMTWFRKEFMQWVDSPICAKTEACKKKKSVYCGNSYDPGNSSLAWSAHNIELYYCEACGERLEFPRYQDPKSLLKYHSGRCGEFANTFTFICRALGFDARLVHDRSDHAWTEIYSPSVKRWLHCDSCEITCDTPLMYELGWGKTLTYIIAYSPEEVRDVTRRYTHDYEKTKRLRTIDEGILQETIRAANEKRQKHLPQSRREMLKERAEREDKELMSPVNKERQYGGRTSGSLAWRKQRGEVSPDILEKNGYTWILNEDEMNKKLFHLSYNCSSDEYDRRAGGKDPIVGWKNGVYSAESMQRKCEHDSKMCYLTREEDAPKSSISWKFKVPKSSENLRIGKVKITLPSEKLTRNAYISITICSKKTVCLLQPFLQDYLETEQFRGNSELFIKVVMAGGNWDTTQLFRMSDESENIFEVTMTLAKVRLHISKGKAGSKNKKKNNKKKN